MQNSLQLTTTINDPQPLSAMSTQPQESTLTPPPVCENDPAAPRLTLEEQKAHYEKVIARVRSLTFKWQDIDSAVKLIEIEDLARKSVQELESKITKADKNWNPEPYHQKILKAPPWTDYPDTPDAFFSRHADTKARLILRLGGKAILPKVKVLLQSAPGILLVLISEFDAFELHDQIKGFIEIFDRNSTETRRDEPNRKRQRGQQCFDVVNVHH